MILYVTDYIERRSTFQLELVKLDIVFVVLDCYTNCSKALEDTFESSEAAIRFTGDRLGFTNEDRAFK